MLQNIKRSKIEKNTGMARMAYKTGHSSLHTDSFWILHFPSSRNYGWY